MSMAAFQEPMEIAPLINIPRSLTLFIAPPAWGKTSLLLQLDGPWIFVSPLRALAEEFAARVLESEKRVRIVRSRNDEAWKSFAQNPKGILVATPETLPTHLPLLIRKKCFLVLDEFHLFMSWGASFRPYLLEQFYAWGAQGSRILALSATIELDQMNEIKKWREHVFDSLFVIDLGNMQFKNKPFKQLNYGKNIGALKRRFVFEVKRKKSSGIIFCHTRNEVAQWCSWIESQGLVALGCVGGEVEAFRESLAKLKKIDWIVSTSVLSHGVNLPSFEHVFIAYKTDSPSMWLQMAARGGRRGEAFQLHSLESATFKHKCLIWCFDMLIKIKLYLKP